jgi:hypothetical protein
VRVRTAVAALGVIGACLLAPQPARASDLEIGSWWQAQPDAGVLTPPPTVEAGSAWMSSAASGPTAFTAVPSRPLPPLVLRLKSAQPDALGPVSACVTTGPWLPATAGPWSARPTYDCAKGRATGITSLDNKTMTFDLALLEPVAKVDLVLVPTQSAPPVPSVSAPVAVPGLMPTLPPYFNTFDITAAVVPPAVSLPSAPPPTVPAGALAEPPPQVATTTPASSTPIEIPRSVEPSEAPLTSVPAVATRQPTLTTGAAPLRPVAATKPTKDLPLWRIAVAILLIGGGLELSRTRPGQKPLGGLRSS